MSDMIKKMFDQLLLVQNWSQILIVIGIIAFSYLAVRILYNRRTNKNPHLDILYSLAFPLLALMLFVAATTIMNFYTKPFNIINYGIPLSVAMIVIKSVVYVLRIIFPKAQKLETWENVLAIIVWSAFAIYILGWFNPMIKAIEEIGFTVNDRKITLLWLFKIVVTISLFVLVASWLSMAIDRQIKRQKRLTSRTRLAISKSVRVILLTLATLIALDSIGVDLTTLTVLGGALGVGIGFGLQRIASNFISGFILLFDKSIRPGDVITIGNSFGWISELRARYVVIRDRDGVDTLIPNENLITSQVINWSYSDKNVRQKLPVSVSYNDDIHLAMKVMIEAAKSNRRVNQQPEAVCRLMEFGDHGIKLELRYWITDPEEGVNNLRSEIALAIWDQFKAKGITIPFPQRDLHLKDIPDKSVMINTSHD